MKKSIISLVLVLSFCFQSTYPLFEGLKQKKDQAMKLLKRLGPKRLIARYNEAKKKKNEAWKTYSICRTKHCKEEYEKQSNALKLFQAGGSEKQSIVYRERYNQAYAKFQVCVDDHCTNERNAYNQASDPEGVLYEAIVVAMGLGWIVLIGGVLYLDKKAENEKRESVKKREKRRSDQALWRQTKGIW